MYARWKRRARVSRKRGVVRPTGRYLLCAVLVESERRAGGPRQKVVAHLASIAEENVGDVLHAGRFWRAVDARLSAVAAGQAVRLDALLKAVPRPAPAQYQEAQRQTAAELAALAEALKRLR